MDTTPNQSIIQYYSDENDYTFAIDKIWTIITGTSIFSMMIGFAFLEAGSVRKKNTHIVFYKIMLHSLIIVLAYWLIGYAFSFGDESIYFIGGKKFYAGDSWDQPQKNIQENTQYSNWVLQYGVATVVVAITNGSISERTSLVATSIQAFLMASIIYPVVVAWTWGKGWLDGLGFVDFSGSGIVHCTGAYAGLAGILIVGPRHNRYGESENIMKVKIKTQQNKEVEQKVLEGYDFLASSGSTFFNREGANNLKKITQLRINQLRQRVLDEEYENFAVSNLAYTLFGGLWLWMGFILYNAGSTIGVLKSSHDLWIQSETAAVNTFLAGSAGGLYCLLFRNPIMHGWKASRKLREEAPAVCNAYLAGMVACGAGMNLYVPWAAFVAGLFGGIFYVGLCKLFEQLKIDDACEAFQLHGGGGTAGLFLNALLHPFKGLIYNSPEKGQFFGAQITGWFVIAGWSFICNLMIWSILKKFKILRTDLKTEIVGYDFAEFAEEYDIPGQEYLHMKSHHKNVFSSVSDASDNPLTPKIAPIILEPNPALGRRGVNIEMNLL